jgi:hypothetical protein
VDVLDGAGLGRAARRRRRVVGFAAAAVVAAVVAARALAPAPERAPLAAVAVPAPAPNPAAALSPLEAPPPAALPAEASAPVAARPARRRPARDRPPSPAAAQAIAPAPATSALLPPAPPPPAPAPPPAPRVDIERATASITGITAQSGIPAANIRAALGRLPLVRCYRDALRGGAVGSGTATLRLRIDSGGYVTGAALAGAAVTPALKACIEKAATALRVKDVDTGDATADVALSFVATP